MVGAKHGHDRVTRDQGSLQRGAGGTGSALLRSPPGLLHASLADVQGPTDLPSGSRSVLRHHGWRGGRRVVARRAVVDELDREWRPGEQIIVELPDGRWCAVGSSVFRSQVLPQGCCQLLQFAPAPLRCATAAGG
jgi:hypothetical protein